MSSSDERLLAPHASGLRELALRSIRRGLDQGQPLDVDPSEYAPELRAPRATFVTLTRANALRGCTGSLEARRALVVDIAHNAYGSAFADPRFAALTQAELEGLEVNLSILSELEPLQVASEAELIAQLRPKVDGLVLREGHRVGTYMPAVWDTLPDARLFLRDLKKKAGLPEGYWSSTLELARYTVTTLP